MNFGDLLNAIVVFDKLNLVEEKKAAVQVLGLMIRGAIDHLTPKVTVEQN